MSGHVSKVLKEVWERQHVWRILKGMLDGRKVNPYGFGKLDGEDAHIVVFKDSHMGVFTAETLESMLEGERVRRIEPNQTARGAWYRIDCSDEEKVHFVMNENTADLLSSHLERCVSAEQVYGQKSL